MSRLKVLAAFGALACLSAPAALPQDTTFSPICDAYFAPKGEHFTQTAQRWIYQASTDAPFRGRSGTGRGTVGSFKPTGDMAFWSNKNDDYPTGYFTTRKGTTIEFQPDDGYGEAIGPPQQVRFGSVDGKDVQGYFRLRRGVPCDGRTPSYTDEPPSAGSSLKEFMDKSTAPRGTAERPGTGPERGTARPDLHARPKELTELFKPKAPPAPPAVTNPPATTPHAPGAPPAVAAPPPPPPAATPPARTPAAAPKWDATTVPADQTAVCRFDTFATLPFSEGTPPRAAQAYAFRNKRAKVPAHDYVDTIGEVLPFQAEVDVSMSANKLIPYESVAFVRGKTTWVSVPGAKLISATPEVAKPRAKATLRLLVVSGAQELLISGLDRVGAELAKAPAIDVKPLIDWHLVEPSGDLQPAQRFTSFEALVEAAGERSRGERMDVLSESQLAKMLDQFEALLLGQPTPLDRVIWIKGAYPIPGTFPPRLETFLTKVAESNALNKLVSGRPGKWFTIVTARILGFSIAYLKEPVYSLQAGDVIEEDPAAIGAKRGLIPDIGLFATRLRTGLKVEAAPDAPDASTPTRLVQDAADVFAERGYILSRAETSSLRSYLQEVQQIWTDSDKLDGANLSKFAQGLHVGETVTLLDILQGGRPGKFPRLPRSAPDSLRKAAAGLTPQENRETREFVRRYTEGVGRVDALLAGEKAQKCGFLFVTEDALGIVGNSR